MTNTEIDKALAKNLEPEGLARLKAVELSIKLAKASPPASLEAFQKQYESIYKFIMKKQ